MDLNKYQNFSYDSYEYCQSDTPDGNSLVLRFHYTTEGLTSFVHEITIPMQQAKTLENIDSFVFHIGMVELISYWKATLSPNVLIKCGTLSAEQIKWFKKLYFYGLGELLYRNGIETDIENFMHITCADGAPIFEKVSCTGSGAIIPVGGGKDSCLSLELTPQNSNNLASVVNPKEPHIECARLAGYVDDNFIKMHRTIDPNLLELNNRGFVNGHTPFSAMLAFLNLFIAYITGRKYIALSNESSSNEANIPGTKINHQYSKSIEFEDDFREYVSQYICDGIEYFSFLRPLSELQIAMLFAELKKYHGVFKSCNIGSKSSPWIWCCDCPKCLFVFTILSPFLPMERLIDIFGEDLLAKSSLRQTLIDLVGNGKTKPFECVGTFEEVRWALNPMRDLSVLSLYNEKNNLPTEFDEVLKAAIQAAGDAVIV